MLKSFLRRRTATKIKGLGSQCCGSTWSTFVGWFCCCTLADVLHCVACCWRVIPNISEYCWYVSQGLGLMTFEWWCLSASRTTRCGLWCQLMRAGCDLVLRLALLLYCWVSKPQGQQVLQIERRWDPNWLVNWRVLLWMPAWKNVW